jgi:type IV secretory pathway VirB10-like protein
MIASEDSTKDSDQTRLSDDQMPANDERSVVPDRVLPGSESEARSRVGASPLWPPLPLAKRLNRNALTVAAALAGVTVLTVVVVTRPARVPPGVAGGSGLAAGEVAPPVPARPVFLDQPPRGAQGADGSVASLTTGASATLPGETRHRAGEDGATGLPVPPPLQSGAGLSASVSGPEDPNSTPDSQDGSAMSARDRGTNGASPRRQAYQAALTSPVMVPERESHSMAATALPPSTEDGIAPGPPSGDTRTRGLPSGEAFVAGSSSPPVSGTGGLNELVPSGSSAPMAVSTQSTSPSRSPAPESVPSGSAYTVRAGTVIPGLLLTGINSDLPGEILGQTSRDVFDSRTEQILLVPKGSHLIGAYDNRSVNTGRLIVAWTRLILPDGRSWSLPHLAATDETGEIGLHDKVNHHYARVYGAALLTSVISAGVQLSQPQQSALYAAPSSRQVAAGALGQNLGDIALESAKRGLDTPPTVTIRPGQPFDVFLAGDIVFDGPYIAAPFSVGR